MLTFYDESPEKKNVSQIWNYMNDCNTATKKKKHNTAGPQSTVLFKVILL